MSISLEENDWVGTCQYRRMWLNNIYNQKQKLSYKSLYSYLLNPDNQIFHNCEAVQLQPTILKQETVLQQFNKIYGKNLKTNEIFELYRKHDLDAERFIDEFKLNLAMSLSGIINILDPDAFIFGGGVSNEIDFLSEIESMIKKFVIGKEYDGVFLKPKFGDASGVRGAARLGRSATY